MSTGVRITVPSSRIIIMSSSPVQTFMQASLPVFSVIALAITPLPPRWRSGYSSSSVRLPMPFSVMESTVMPGAMRFTSITSSPSSSVMALTPIDLTSPSLKRRHLPSRVPMSRSSSPFESSTLISSSPSLRFWAIMPPLRMLSKSLMGVFFITPSFVASTRYSPSVSLSTGNTAVIFSPPASCSRFTIAVPLAVREASGML